jgi:hypothetical protein
MAFNANELQLLVNEFGTVAFRAFHGGQATGSQSVHDRKIRAWFGCSLLVLAKVWCRLCQQFPNGRMPECVTKERLLWALILLKSYDTEEVNASRVGCVDEGTFQYWSWWFVDEISFLEHVVVSNESLHSPINKRSHFLFVKDSVGE